MKLKIIIRLLLLYGQCWLYGCILLYGIEMVNRFSNFIESKTSSPIPEIINCVIVMFGPLLLFFLARDYSKIRFVKQEYVDMNPWKSALWVSFLILFLFLVLNNTIIYQGK